MPYFVKIYPVVEKLKEHKQKQYEDARARAYTHNMSHLILLFFLFKDSNAATVL